LDCGAKEVEATAVQTLREFEPAAPFVRRAGWQKPAQKKFRLVKSFTIMA
jgi:hypothetical protein